ncbi:hypothetical protein HY493_05860 [Candidatus Woesearchaeota archaeon]|nr:hypothetical protein [Candidatus Woesearchaeota archaeon]
MSGCEELADILEKGFPESVSPIVYIGSKLEKAMSETEQNDACGGIFYRYLSDPAQGDAVLLARSYRTSPDKVQRALIERLVEYSRQSVLLNADPREAAQHIPHLEREIARLDAQARPIRERYDALAAEHDEARGSAWKQGRLRKKINEVHVELAPLEKELGPLTARYRAYKRILDFHQSGQAAQLMQRRVKRAQEYHRLVEENYFVRAYAASEQTSSCRPVDSSQLTAIQSQLGALKEQLDRLEKAYPTQGSSIVPSEILDQISGLREEIRRVSGTRDNTIVHGEPARKEPEKQREFGSGMIDFDKDFK